MEIMISMLPALFSRFNKYVESLTENNNANAAMIDKGSLNILPASSEERDWAAQLFSSSDPWKTLGIKHENLKATCHDPEYFVYIARQDGNACGVIILDPRGVAGAPYVKSIVVAEGYRGNGIGAALVAFAENVFKQTSHHLFLCVSSFNQRARLFYERLGYNIIGELKDHIKEGESEILMHKRIS